MTGTLYEVTFYIIATLVLVSGLAVVMLRNIVHAALALIATFFMVSWLYLMMNADLLWVAQLLIYAGAIPVLLVFAIMFTRRSMSDTSNLDVGNRVLSGLVGGGVFAILLGVLLPAHWHLATWPNLQTTTEAIGKSLVNSYAVPFELVSVLLLAGLIGAVVLAKREVGE